MNGVVWRYAEPESARIARGAMALIWYRFRLGWRGALVGSVEVTDATLEMFAPAHIAQLCEETYDP